jgi:hypothetical protein
VINFAIAGAVRCDAILEPGGLLGDDFGERRDLPPLPAVSEL